MLNTSLGQTNASQTGCCLLNWKSRVTIKEEVRIRKESSCAPPDSLQLSLLLCGRLCAGLGKEGKAQQQGGEKQAQAFQEAEFQSAMTQEKKVPPTAVPGPRRGQ